MHRFQTHTDSVFIVESHPSFQSIFLTAGHDGRIIIWDFLAQDPIIKILFNKVNEGVGAVFDAKFSPANFSIAATDNHGNVCIYGMETSEDFIAFPDQQFFHTDYRPICVEDNVTYDEQTGMLPHEMYPPYMVNMDGDPHPSIFQQAHLNRFNIFDKYELERLGFYKLKAENNPTIGSLQAGIAEGVRQIENIHITTPIETEDVRKWRKRIIVPQLTSDRLYEVRSRVQNLYKQECEFYKNIEKSFSPQKLNDIGRKKKLLSLKAKILQSRNAATVEVIEEPVQESPIQTVHEVIQSEESSFVTDSEFTTEVEYVDSSQSSECDVKREICTRRNRYIFNDDRQSSTTPSTDPIYNVQNPTITKDWLLVEKQMRSPYFPQVGDVVTYHLLGHKMYVNHVCNNKLFYINKNRLCYNRIKFKDVEICRVTNANFFDIYPYLCSLTLTKLDASGTYSTGLNFNVQFTDIYNVDDFLVLKQFYDEAVARHWNEGNRFQSYIDEEWFYGTIEEIVYNERFPESYFRNLKVRWNSGESDTLSPWDVFPISTRTPNVKYREEEADWAPETKAEAKHRILAGFEAIQLTQQFRDVEDYLNENSADIPFATSYCKIIRKISNDFYRRKKAIIWELRMILHNLGSLKAPSNIMENSEILTKSLIYFIKNLCYNVAEIIDSTTVNSELGAAESTDSCILRRSSRRKEVVLPEFRWFMEAIDLWNDLTGLTDAQPFLAPVDVEEYPDYLSVIKTPMDFSKVHHNLMSGNYLTPDQFINDINLIFQNSRSYNVNRRSTIYGMTLRLNNFFNKKLDRLLPRWRAENLNSNAHLTRHKISQFLGNLNQNGSQSVVESKQRMRKLTINETNSTPIARRLRKRKPADNGSVVDDTDISISIDNKPPPQNSSNKPRRRSKRFVEDPDAQSTSPLQSPIIKATKRIYRTRASAKFMLKESSNNTPSTSFSNPTSTDSSPKRKPRSKKNKIRKRKSSLQDSGSVNTSISPSELDDLREISLKYNLRSKRPEVGENRISARLRKRKK
ncbi:Bromodomain and WD repeat-containing protein 1 [Thelohanellus kitauei]|uniref:Bromodomain and WD repeat-containing protein 1 n=1 Tax=Thelohanellus kitauei TaxID=669202 RepID=A0A0C2JDY3_THEKT|nr:Bromodomain and WD repeat-containing protein 1 [Thelohanellus kitauei]